MSTSRTFASPTISPLLLEREYGMRNSSLTGFQPCACGIAAQPSRVVVMPRNMSSFLMISAPAPVAATAADASTAVAEAVRRSPHLAFAGKRRRRAMSLEIVTAMPSHGLTLQFLAALYNFPWVARRGVRMRALMMVALTAVTTTMMPATVGTQQSDDPNRCFAR